MLSKVLHHKRAKSTLLALTTRALNGVIFRDLELKGPDYMFVYEILTVNIWKLAPVRAGVKRAGINLGPV